MTCPGCAAPNPEGARSCVACGAPLGEQAAAVAPGAVFAGRYELLGALGKGGMGMVYRARDTSLDETVALKVIRPDLARQADLHRRFRSEIKLARRIRHRNVCSIFGDGEDQGLLYLCMELVEGIDLRRHVKQRGGLPWPEAFEVAIQVAEGLQAIHDVGIVHRDLKSANVMLDERGLVRLMDFGLAKEWQLDDTSGVTASGHVVGTPDYMSPEQARGESSSFSSDVYALGVLVFELFTGELPFRGDTPLSTLLQHLQQPPPLEGPRAARLPPALVPVLRTALAKTPGERYASASRMAAALRAARDQAHSDSGVTPTHLEIPTQAPVAHAGVSGPVQASVSWGRTLALRLGRSGWRLAPAAVAVVALAGWLLSRPARQAEVASVALSPSPSSPDRPQAEQAPALTARRPQVEEAAAAAAAAAVVTMAAPPPSSGGLAPPATAAPRAIGSSRIDAAGEWIRHAPVGCMVAGQFPLIRAELAGAPAAAGEARLYFRSALGSAYYFVRMQRAAAAAAGKMPKPNLKASPIDYYIEQDGPQGRVRTPEASAIVVPRAADCPAGSRVAEIGPAGAVTVFSAISPAVGLKNALGLDALIALLKDPDAGVRGEAAGAIRGLMPSVRTTIDRLLAQLGDKDPDERERAAEDLGDISRVIVGEAVNPLIGSLKDPTAGVRLKAVEALGEVAPLVASAAGALRPLLQDASPGVRKAAAQALGSAGSVVGTALVALEDVEVGDDDAELRSAVARARKRIEAAAR